MKLQQAHVISMEARPPNIEGKNEVTQRDLVRNALRMRPDRIIIGEVRGAEAFDMLQAMNTGHEGSLTTIHANSPRDAHHPHREHGDDGGLRPAGARDPRADRRGAAPGHPARALLRRQAARHARSRRSRAAKATRSRCRTSSSFRPGAASTRRATSSAQLEPTGIVPTFTDEFALSGVEPATWACGFAERRRSMTFRCSPRSRRPARSRLLRPAAVARPRESQPGGRAPAAAGRDARSRAAAACRGTRCAAAGHHRCRCFRDWLLESAWAQRMTLEIEAGRPEAARRRVPARCASRLRRRGVRRRSSLIGRSAVAFVLGAGVAASSASCCRPSGSRCCAARRIEQITQAAAGSRRR